MQRFVRYTLTSIVSLGALAALSACGTKDTTTVEPSNQSPATITSVQVSPPSTTLSVGGTVAGDPASVALVATVTADSALPRTVTWSSGNTAVATVSATGVVSAVAAGSTTITATSTYLASATGGASITVVAGTATTTTAAVVSIASVLQGPCSIPTCSINLAVAQGLPVDLTNIQGQINVNVNYDPGTTTPKSIGLFLTPSGGAAQACGVLNIGTASSSRKPANGSVSTVTFTCNTAAFTAPTTALTTATQGSVTNWKNGQYTLSAVYTDANNVTASASATQLATLNNGDWMYAAFANPATTATAPQLATASDTNGFLWHAGSVNTVVYPVLYTPGRSIASANISLISAANPTNGANTPGAGHASLGGAEVLCGGTLSTQVGVSAFPTPVAFALGTKAAASGVFGVTADTVAISVATVDNLGNNGPGVNAASGCGTAIPAPSVVGGGVLPAANFIRLDNVGPNAGAYVVTQGNAGAPPSVANGAVPFVYGPVATGDTDWVNANNTQNAVAPTIVQLTAQPGVWLSGLTYTFSGSAGGYLASPTNASGNLTDATGKVLTPASYCAQVNGTACPNLVANGDSSGVGKTKVSFAFAPAVAGAKPSSSTVYTPVTAATAIAPTSAATAYWLEMIERDTLGNTTTTQLSWGGCPACTTGTSTFGIDNVAPVTTAVGPVNDEIDGSGINISHTTLVVTANDPQNTNGTSGSGFSASPVSYTIAGLQGLTGKSGVCAAGSGNSCTAVFSPLTVPVAAAAQADGDWLMTYKTYDQAGNPTASNTIAWYIEHAAPTVASPGDIALPSSIDSTFAFSETVFDSLYLTGGNGRLQYCLGATPCARFAAGAINFFYPGVLSVAAGVPFSQKAVKTGSVSVNLNQWFRSMFQMVNGAGGSNGSFANSPAQALPDSIAIRAVNAAGNLSKEDAAGIPGGNDSFVTVANSVNPYLFTPAVGANITDFILNGGFSATFGGSGFPTVSLTGATAGASTSTTITATVPVPTGVIASPFVQVCFYFQGNAGPIVAGGPAIAENGAGGINGMGPNEYALIGCQANPTTTVNGANVRSFSYTSASYTPNAKLLVAGSPAQLNIIAVGVNATHDAIVSPPAQITIVP